MQGQFCAFRGLTHLVHQTQMRFQGALQGLPMLVHVPCRPKKFVDFREKPLRDLLEIPQACGLALQALLAGGASGAAATSTQLLLDIQGPDGAFSSYGTPNTNSSGVAGQALRAAGRTKAADAAGAFVLTLQYGCDAPAANRGAFPWAECNFFPHAGGCSFSTPFPQMDMSQTLWGKPMKVAYVAVYNKEPRH